VSILSHQKEEQGSGGPLSSRKFGYRDDATLEGPHQWEEPPRYTLAAAAVQPIFTENRFGPILRRTGIFRSQFTVKAVGLVAVPPGVVTRIFPVTAPAGTVAVIVVSEFTEKTATFPPPKVTLLACVRLFPVRVT
jgi:hypothetical protein